MKKIRVAIIGMGWFGNFHAGMLNEHPDAEFVAFTVRTEAARLMEGKKYPQAASYTDYHQMMDEEELDAVIVCVQPDAHGDIEEYAAAKGIALYVEKPIGLSLEEAKRKERIIIEKDIICSVGYHERYHPELIEVQRKIAGAKSCMVTARWIGGTPGALWWRQKQRSGGQVVEQTTHLFDMLHGLFGRFESVYAQGIPCKSNLPMADVEDASIAVVTFANGVIASVGSADYLDLEQTPGDIGLTIYLANETIQYNWDGSVVYRTQTKTETRTFAKSRHQLAINAFLDAVRTGNREGIKTSYSDAVEVLAATLAVNESITTGQRIRL